MTRLFIIIVLLFSSLIGGGAIHAAQTPAPPLATNLQDLLKRVEAGHIVDIHKAAEREKKFLANQHRQQAELKRVQESITRAEAKSLRLEKRFNENETRIVELQALLNERLGVLGALFGQVRLSAEQMAGQIEASLISGEHKGRGTALKTLANSTTLPAIKELETLWHRLHGEMTAQGEVKYFKGQVIGADGRVATQTLLRIGGFVALSEAGMVRYQGDKRSDKVSDKISDKISDKVGSNERFVLPPRQPSSRFLSVADDLYSGDNDDFLAVIDPSRGGLLDVLVLLPSMGERLAQGGIIGTLIIILGLVGLGLVSNRLWHLYKNNKQITNANSTQMNALTRVLASVRDDIKAGAATDAIEIKLDDAILKELPILQKHLSLVKVLAAIAPLLGLLGTVTGMIITFEAIARFGTGDPKLMADGISQALMTTVLGLLVAIPLLGLHALASSTARGIAHILEEQAAGLLAEQVSRKEKEEKVKAS